MTEPGELVPQPPLPGGSIVAPSGDAPAHEILDCRDPKEILARLAHGDPLHLYERCAQQTRERCLLIDVDRLFELALAVVATTAAVVPGDRVGTSDWMNSQIDRAIDSILNEDQETERRAVDPCDPEDPSFALVRDVFGVEPTLARSVTVVFNGLPRRIRRVFFALVVEARSIDECVEEGLGNVESLRTSVRHAFRVLGHLDDSHDRSSGKEDLT